MAYDEKLAERIRLSLASKRGVVEKKMFGGVAFLFQGNMACGVNKDDLIVRLSEAVFDDAMNHKHVRIFDTMGKPMRGWILVAPAGCKSDAALRSWIDIGIAYAKSLPAK
jgi:TfoX N-terminal domain